MGTVAKFIRLFFRGRELREVRMFDAWEVRWTSRHSEYSSGTKPEMVLFPTEQEAREFADALRDAYKLLRHTSQTEVQLKRQSSV